MATYVVNAGLDITTNRLKGAGTEPLYIGWGVSAGTTAKTDTTLFGERLVDLATAAGTVTNAGLFDAASGGNLYLKGDFTGIGLAAGDAIAFTINSVYS